MCTIAVWDSRKIRVDELFRLLRSLSLPYPLHRVSRLEEKLSLEDVQRHEVFVLSFDEQYKTALSVAEYIRAQNQCAMIILLVSSESDLLPFIKPSVAPSGFLTRPIDKQKLLLLLGDVGAELKRTNVSTEDSIFVRIDGKAYSFTPSEIYFFEAFGKKIVLRSLGQEIEYYDSLKSIRERLPKYFMQCHRSYIINIRLIQTIHFAESEIIMKNGASIPVSRSYKSNILDLVGD